VTERDDRVAVAIDLGTTGLKVGLVSFDGTVLWSDHAACRTIESPGGGREQDADVWWDTIASMIRASVASGVVRPEQVAVVAATGQWASTVPVDADGNPVGNCVMWTDSRGRRHTKERFGGPVAGYSAAVLPRWIRKTGGVPAPSGKGPTGQHLFLTRDRPDIAAAARWFLEPVDYLTMRFTGVASATHASMTASWLTDMRRLDVMEYDADLVARAGVDASKLPPLVPESSVIAGVRDDVAPQLGIPAGTPVVTGLPDIATAGPGAGAVNAGEAHLVISTTSWISCAAPAKKTNIFNEITTAAAARPGEYLVLDNIDTAGACLDWFRRLVSLDGHRDGELVDAGDLIDLATTVPPGSRGVVFTPWLNGANAPIADSSARAGFHNVRLDTGAAEMARAVLEGVAVQNAMLLGAVEKFVGRRLDPIRIIGGGARSDLWCQMHADAMDRVLERPADPLNAGLRGATLNAAVSIGAIDGSDIRDRVKVETTFRSDPERRALFDGLLAGQRKLHKGQKRPLRALTRATRTPG
jgi:xylulokinase